MPAKRMVQTAPLVLKLAPRIPTELQQSPAHKEKHRTLNSKFETTSPRLDLSQDSDTCVISHLQLLQADPYQMPCPTPQHHPLNLLLRLKP